MEEIIFVVTVTAIALIPGMIGFGAVRWCLKRGWRAVGLLVLAVLGAGVVYGALRFTGALQFAGDTSGSFHFFDTSYGDEGFLHLYLCGALFAGTAAALAAGYRKSSASAAAEEGKS